MALKSRGEAYQAPRPELAPSRQRCPGVHPEFFKAPGPDFVDLGESKRPFPSPKLMGKRGGRSPPLFPVGFGEGSDRLDPQQIDEIWARTELK